MYRRPTRETMSFGGGERREIAAPDRLEIVRSAGGSLQPAEQGRDPQPATFEPEEKGQPVKVKPSDRRFRIGETVRHPPLCRMDVPDRDRAAPPEVPNFLVGQFSTGRPREQFPTVQRN